MTTRISDATANALVDAVCGRADAGAGAATIQIRTGSQPATADTTATGTVVATVTCSDPAFGASSSRSAALAGVPKSDTSADATGTAGWFRILDSNGATVLDGDCTSTATGTGNMLIDNPALVAGQTFTISALTISVA